MEPKLITYQKFNDLALAEALADTLARHNINYSIEEESLTFNPSFVLDNELSKEFAVKISGDDFERVNQIITEEESANINEVEKDYYLFNFSDAELIELISKADEWSAFDNLLARKILTDRGVAITDETVANLNEKRIEELKTPEPSQNTWVIIGYVIAIGSTLLPFFVIIIGVFIGWHLFSHKKTLPDGERVYGYNENDRKHGKRIFYLAIIIFLLEVIYYIYKVSSK